LIWETFLQTESLDSALIFPETFLQDQTRANCLKFARKKPKFGTVWFIIASHPWTKMLAFLVVALGKLAAACIAFHQCQISQAPVFVFWTFLVIDRTDLEFVCIVHVWFPVFFYLWMFLCILLHCTIVLCHSICS
jgi:hypothetical protein